MSIFEVLNLIGGLSLFLLGMKMMGDALEKRAGSKLKGILGRMAGSPFKGFLIGLGATAIIQSSSATTVMVVGFVNSGVMQLSQAINVIMGANVGTTVTAWILSLTGIESGNIFVKLLKPTSFTPVLALVGIILYMFQKNDKRKDTGFALLGFSVLMTGMDMMSSAVQPLANVREFTNILLMFENPVLGVLAGAALTAVVQSSSASVGILQALSVTGGISNAAAIPIIMGQNIGTCVTALISSVGANKNARRAAMVHLYFNLIGTAVWLTVFVILRSVVHLPALSTIATPLSISILHSSFNILSTALLLPFGRQLEKLACLTIRDSKDKNDTNQLLDERLFVTPAVALERARTVAVAMENTSFSAMRDAIGLMENYDAKTAQQINASEDSVDAYEDALGSYLVKLAEHSLAETESQELSELLRMIGDFERISDHAVNIMESAAEKNDKSLRFSAEAWNELTVMMNAVLEIMSLSGHAFENGDMACARLVEPLEQVVDDLQKEIKSRHIGRLTAGKCTIEMGFVLADLLTNLERVSDHCSNIAACVAEISKNRLNMHAYTQNLKDDVSERFDMRYSEFRKKYALPMEQ